MKVTRVALLGGTGIAGRRWCVLVLGGTGFVGRNVMDVLRRASIPCVSASRSEGPDVRDPAAARALLEKHRPEVVVNCAAHVGSLNYVTKQAADVVADNTRMILRYLISGTEWTKGLR